MYHHAVPMQPPSYYYPPVLPVPPPPPPSEQLPVKVVRVWKDNFDDESNKLRLVAANARYVAIDVHYPGLVYRQGHNALTPEQRYAFLKANVDALKPLQVGLAVCDGHGQHFAWEFNLRDFSGAADLHDPSSLAYLADVRGLDLDILRFHGVGAGLFGRMLRGSGLIGRRPGLAWITYTGAYHVAYLLKIVTGGGAMPNDLAGFVDAMRCFLGGEVYDVASMAADCRRGRNKLPVGLDRVAAHLGFHPPWESPKLAGAAGVRALQVFRTLLHGEFAGNVGRYRGLLKGLQH